MDEAAALEKFREAYRGTGKGRWRNIKLDSLKWVTTTSYLKTGRLVEASNTLLNR